MYTHRNFKKGTELRSAIALWLLAAVASDSAVKPQAVSYYQPGPFGGNETQDGSFVVEGPHYPAAHSFYVQCVSRGGIIVWCNGLPASLNPAGKSYNLTKGIAELRKKFPDLEAKVRGEVGPVGSRL